MLIGTITVLGVQFEVLLRPVRRPGLVAGKGREVITTTGETVPSEPPPSSNVRPLFPSRRECA